MPVPVFAELRRRRVFRALLGYGIASFAVLQIIEPIMHGLHWPDAVLSYVVVPLAVGFPVVVSLEDDVRDLPLPLAAEHAGSGADGGAARALGRHRLGGEGAG